MWKCWVELDRRKDVGLNVYLNKNILKEYNGSILKETDSLQDGVV